MTTSRLAAALHALHWTPTDFAREVNVNDRTVRRWIAEQNPAPEILLDWLDDLARYHKAHPAPLARRYF